MHQCMDINAVVANALASVIQGASQECMPLALQKDLAVSCNS